MYTLAVGGRLPSAPFPTGGILQFKHIPTSLVKIYSRLPGVSLFPGWNFMVITLVQNWQIVEPTFHVSLLCIVLSILNECPLKSFLCLFFGLVARLIWALSLKAEWGSGTPALSRFLLVWPWAGIWHLWSFHIPEMGANLSSRNAYEGIIKNSPKCSTYNNAPWNVISAAAATLIISHICFDLWHTLFVQHLIIRMIRGDLEMCSPSLGPHAHVFLSSLLPRQADLFMLTPTTWASVL